MEKDKTLQDARQYWLIAEVEKMKLANPVTDISFKTGYGKSAVSEILNKKSGMSLRFFRTFCEKFGFDVDAINHIIIDGIRKELNPLNLTNNFTNKNDQNSKLIQNGEILSPLTKTDEPMVNLLIAEMRETINWQREFMDKMVERLPATKKGSQPRKKDVSKKSAA